MLVIISDLHLTDGSSGKTIKAGAFRRFVESLKGRVRDACWRSSPDADGGVFAPIKRCDIILLGDILDIIRSDEWLKTGATDRGGLRPWSDSVKIAPLVAKIAEKILKNNDDSLSCLRSLGQGVGVSDGAGGPESTVRIFIHYFVGNHDWFLHVDHPAYKGIRQRIKTAMGLANDAAKPFPHLLREAGATARRIADHRVYLQHGDIHDEFNFEADWGRDHSSLGDCIVVELLNSFPLKVQKALKLSGDDPLIRQLREIDNVRPSLAIPEWIDGLLRRSADPDVRKKVLRVWEKRVDDFLKIDFVKSHDRPWRWDTVDGLQLALRISGGLSLRSLSGVARRLERHMRSDGYTKYALKEKALKTKADFVVYGHTHQPVVVPLDLVPNKPPLREQVYINTGTWRRVHQRCEAEPAAREFASFDVMTMAYFYKDGERMGRRYETWTGQLA